MKKRALISVYDKEGILDLADFLINEGWEYFPQVALQNI